MRKTVDAVYEKGLIKPLEPLALSESQRITVTIETGESLVLSTKAFIKAPPSLIEHIAEHDEYLDDLSSCP